MMKDLEGHAALQRLDATCNAAEALTAQIAALGTPDAPAGACTPALILLLPFEISHMGSRFSCDLKSQQEAEKSCMKSYTGVSNRQAESPTSNLVKSPRLTPLRLRDAETLLAE